MIEKKNDSIFFLVYILCLLEQAHRLLEQLDSGNNVEVNALIPDGWSAEDWTMTIDLDKNLQIQQSISEADVLNDVRQMYSSEENIEHEEGKETKEENKVTALSRRDMLKAIETLRKGLLFLNVDEWSLLSKLDHAVDQCSATGVPRSCARGAAVFLETFLSCLCVCLGFLSCL